MVGRPASTNSDVVGVVLKAPRIQWTAECHTAAYGTEANLTGGGDRSTHSSIA